MNITVKKKFHSSICFQENQVEVIGSLLLLKKIENLRKRFGEHPKNWILDKFENTSEDILLDEFIKKVKNETYLTYSHAELCHCRLVPTDKVKNAIMEGCLTVAEVSRVTLAGTGCGSCKKDIQAIINEISKKHLA